MARIRTIKPQFWTDETVGKLSWGARLLFIATWNLADDEGILIWNAAYLRGQVFPYDKYVSVAKIKGLMQELIDKNLIKKYDVGGDVYANVASFSRHQVISKPQPSTKPLPTFAGFVPRFTKDSRNVPILFPDHSWVEKEGNKEKEKEGNKEGNGKTAISDKNNEIKPDNLPSLKKDSKTRTTTEAEFLEYVEETKSEFPDLDCEVEFKKFNLWYSGKGKKPKLPKLAWFNWLDKARRMEQERGGSRNKTHLPPPEILEGLVE